MEYVRYHGEFDDVPLAEMIASLREHYPGFAASSTVSADFPTDVEAEVDDD